MIAWTLWLDAAPHDNRKFPETIQPGHRSMCVIAHPQGLTALLTLLFQWGQRHRMRRFRTRCSSSHLFAPFALTLDYWDYSSSFCCQPIPAVKVSFPFSHFVLPTIHLSLLLDRRTLALFVPNQRVPAPLHDPGSFSRCFADVGEKYSAIL